MKRPTPQAARPPGFPRGPLYAAGAENPAFSMYNLDGGGPRAVAGVREHLDRLAAAGADVCCISCEPKVKSLWAAERIRKDGRFKVGLCLDFGRISRYFGPADGILTAGAFAKPADQFEKYKGDYHTGYKTLDSHSAYATCPNYRGPFFEGAVANYRHALEVVRPDVVVGDSELYVRPGTTTPWDWDLGQIKACERCGTIERYVEGWRGVADAQLAAVREIVPNARLFDFGTWDWRGAPARGIPASAWWPWDRTFDGPCPALYLPGPVAQTFPPVLARVGVAGGYPWLQAWADKARTRLWTAKEMGEIGTVLARAGAYGFSLWPGPRANEAMLALDPTGERWFALVKAGLAAFGP